MLRIDGVVAPGLEPVRDAFAANFESRDEVGAAVCVYHRGRPVVHLWGGVADPATDRPWRDDTLVLVYSMTKGVTAWSERAAWRLAGAGGAGEAPHKAADRRPPSPPARGRRSVAPEAASCRCAEHRR